MKWFFLFLFLTKSALGNEIGICLQNELLIPTCEEKVAQLDICSDEKVGLEIIYGPEILPLVDLFLNAKAHFFTKRLNKFLIESGHIDSCLTDRIDSHSMESGVFERVLESSALIEHQLKNRESNNLIEAAYSFFLSGNEPNPAMLNSPFYFVSNSDRQIINIIDEQWLGFNSGVRFYDSCASSEDERMKTFMQSLQPRRAAFLHEVPNPYRENLVDLIGLSPQEEYSIEINLDDLKVLCALNLREGATNLKKSYKWEDLAYTFEQLKAEFPPTGNSVLKMIDQGGIIGKKAFDFYQNDINACFRAVGDEIKNDLEESIKKSDQWRVAQAKLQDSYTELIGRFQSFVNIDWKFELLGGEVGEINAILSGLSAPLVSEESKRILVAQIESYEYLQGELRVPYGGNITFRNAYNNYERKTIMFNLPSVFSHEKYELFNFRLMGHEVAHILTAILQKKTEESFSDKTMSDLSDNYLACLRNNSDFSYSLDTIGEDLADLVGIKLVEKEFEGISNEKAIHFLAGFCPNRLSQQIHEQRSQDGHAPTLERMLLHVRHMPSLQEALGCRNVQTTCTLSPAE